MEHGNAIGNAEVFLLLLLGFIILFAVFAKKIETPYPIVLVLAGLVLGFVPGAPRVRLDPEIIFLVFLPPLLYSAAWLTSWRDFSYNLVSILFLAFGLVAFTVFGVAAAVPRLLPGFDWQSALVLGAVVATTDAVAATSIGRNLGLPKRIIDVLEGESLVNDASGLLALEFALAIIAGGHVPTIGFTVWRLSYLIVAGGLAGFVAALLVDRLERYVDDGPVEMGISILVPYGIYLGAEAVHASGIIALVVAGLYLSRRSATLFSPGVRIQLYAVWSGMTFLLNGFVFVLIGLQLPSVLADLGGLRLRDAILYGLMFSLLLIALRLLWIFPGAGIAYLIRRRLLHQNERFPPMRQVFIVGWTGMRGVIALAAALSLPKTLAGGQPFTQRSSILFFTFIVILVTLVVQGLTLPPLIRWLGLVSAGGPDCEEQEARQIVLEAALRHLDSIRQEDLPEFMPVYEHIAQHYRARLFAVTGETDHLQGGPDHVERYKKATRGMRRIERETALRLRNEGRINDEVLRQIERDLDLADLRLADANV